MLALFGAQTGCTRSTWRFQIGNQCVKSILACCVISEFFAAEELFCCYKMGENQELAFEGCLEPEKAEIHCARLSLFSLRLIFLVVLLHLVPFQCSFERG